MLKKFFAKVFRRSYYIEKTGCLGYSSTWFICRTFNRTRLAQFHSFERDTMKKFLRELNSGELCPYDPLLDPYLTDREIQKRPTRMHVGRK